MLLHEVIDTHLAQRPDASAIIDGTDGRSITYAQLHKLVVRYALGLSHAGLAAGDRIAIIARKSPDVIALFLAASRLGIVYVPLDGQASPAYWRTVLHDLGITHIVTNIADLAAKLAGGAGTDESKETSDKDTKNTRVPTHGDGSGFANDGAANDGAANDDPTALQVYDFAAFGEPMSETGKARAEGADTRSGAGSSFEPSVRTSQDDAYILATSGSTGRPKGVLLSHQNALSFVHWATNEVALTPTDRLLSVAPFHFDLSVFDIYGALSRGASVVLAPAMASLFPGQLIETIEREHVTVLYTVPTILRMLDDLGGFAGDATRSLRMIIYAGEPFPTGALRRLMLGLPEVTFYNFFGPTETNVCLAHKFSAVPQADQEVPVGLPASDAKITLVDAMGREVGEDESGQIQVEGPTVMRGYLTVDGLQAANQPFATGDFAQKKADGLYYFQGRQDNQIKLRGMRIELGAIERTLLSVPGVSDARVLLIGTELVAFVEIKTGGATAHLRAICKDKLPPSAIPHKIVALSAFPQLSNGKLDLSKLKTHFIKKS